jgi:predicted transcriptional regulator
MPWKPEYNTKMGPKTPTAKAQMLQALADQPDDSSYEELLRELAFVCMVERGLADATAGRTITHDEMKRTLESWRR